MAVVVTAAYRGAYPTSTPGQHNHVYQAYADASGGTLPYSYSWSSSVGSIIAGSGTDTVLLVVTNSNPTGGVTGTVTCTVNDSGSCSDTDSADLATAPGPFVGPCDCLPDMVPGLNSCECEGSCGPEVCIPANGSNQDGGSGSSGTGAGNGNGGSRYKLPGGNGGGGGGTGGRGGGIDRGDIQSIQTGSMGYLPGGRPDNPVVPAGGGGVNWGGNITTNSG